MATGPTDAELRRFEPLRADHPLVGDPGSPCRACNKAFEAGDVVTLIFLGPGDDDEARKRARAGRPYTGVAVPVHWACATGEET